MSLWTYNKERGTKYIDTKGYRFEARYIIQYDIYQIFILNKGGGVRNPASYIFPPEGAGIEDQKIIDKLFNKLIDHVKAKE